MRARPWIGATVGDASRLFAQLERSQPCAPRARIARQLVWSRSGRLASEQRAECPSAAGAYRLLGRADARAAPLAEGVLHETILARVIADDRHDTTRKEPVSQHGEGVLERGDLVIHGDSKRLEQAREISRPGARPQRAANGTDEVVADGERPRRTTPNNFASEAVRSAFVPIFAKDCCERVPVESIEQLGRGGGFGPGAAFHPGPMRARRGDRRPL